MRRRLFVLALALVAFGLPAWSHAEANTPRKVVRARGADSLAGRIDALSKLYMKDHPDVNIVVMGGSKGIGLERLLDRSGEIALAPRRMTDREKKEASDAGLNLEERLIGYGGIVIVINPGNPIEALTMDQIRKIFTGVYTKWSQVGGPDEPIEVCAIDGETHAGTRFFMTEEFLNKTPFVGSAHNLSSFPSIMRKVAEAKGAIGFTRVRDALESQIAEQVQVRILKVKKEDNSPAVMPSRTAIGDGTYAIRRPWFLYYDKGSAEEVKSFVEFIVNRGWGPQRIHTEQ